MHWLHLTSWNKCVRLLKEIGLLHFFRKVFHVFFHYERNVSILVQILLECIKPSKKGGRNFFHENNTFFVFLKTKVMKTATEKIKGKTRLSFLLRKCHEMLENISKLEINSKCYESNWVKYCKGNKCREGLVHIKWRKHKTEKLPQVSQTHSIITLSNVLNHNAF